LLGKIQIIFTHDYLIHPLNAYKLVQILLCEQPCE